jgi:exopolyphosphatase/guanosine-5'-triphosphate,3'-diphosphate pyrophosphatase
MAASLAEVHVPIARRTRRECYADPSNKNSFMQNGTRLAAVDLGSNSFRLEIGHLDHGQIHRTEYLKETVRQGSGLDEERNLTPEAMQRGWDCLARFGERLAGFKKHHVRAVATQTLREARNRAEFLTEAERILGFPIDVVSGREEARLIYQGVAHSLPQSTERRLVVDIGGRSTELILGTGFEAQVMESYRVGSVAWSMRYFPTRSSHHRPSGWPRLPPRPCSTKRSTPTGPAPGTWPTAPRARSVRSPTCWEWPVVQRPR